MYGPVFNTQGSSFNPTQGSEGSSSPFSKPFASLEANDSLNISGHGEKKKSEGFLGAVKDFGKGIIKGGIETVTSLFTVNGLLMAAGAAAFVALAPAVAIPLLVAGGVTMGGIQIAKGVSSGDWEEAGKGTFTMGASVLGAKVAPKSFKGTGETKFGLIKTTKKDGVVTTSTPTGFFDSTWANIKASFGGKLAKLDKDGKVMLNEEGKPLETKSIFGVGKENWKARFGKDKNQATTPAPAAATTESIEQAEIEATDKPLDTSKATDKSAETPPSQESKELTAREKLEQRLAEKRAKRQEAEQAQQSPSDRVWHMDDRGMGFKTEAMERKQIDSLVSKLQQEVKAATSEAVDKEQGFFGSLMTTPEKEAEVQAAAKAKVLGNYKTELDGMLGGLNPADKAKFIETMDATTPEGQAEFKSLLSKVRSQAVERQKTHQEVTRQDALAGERRLNPEVAKLKQLQRADELTEADTVLLKKLEEKYPHRSAANVKQRRQLTELEDLHNLQTEGSLNSEQTQRMKQLREQFPEHSERLRSLRHLDDIQAMRQDFKSIEGVEDLRSQWEPIRAKGDEYFQKELNYDEFETLRALRGNKTYNFTDKDLARYNELEPKLKQQLQTLEDESNPDIFSNPGILGKDQKALDAEITKVKGLLEPQETVNPSAKELMSLRELDQQAYGSSLKLGVQ